MGQKIIDSLFHKLWETIMGYNVSSTWSLEREKILMTTPTRDHKSKFSRIVTAAIVPSCFRSLLLLTGSVAYNAMCSMSKTAVPLFAPFRDMTRIFSPHASLSLKWKEARCSHNRFSGNHDQHSGHFKEGCG